MADVARGGLPDRAGLRTPRRGDQLLTSGFRRTRAAKRGMRLVVFGRAAALERGRRYDPEVEHLVDVAEVLDGIYAVAEPTDGARWTS